MNHNPVAPQGGQHARGTVDEWLRRQESEHPDDDSADVNNRRFSEWRCSVCGRPLGEHVVDHSGEHTQFACPVTSEDSDPPAQTPLGETGQTKF